MNEEELQAIKELKHFINMTAFWKEKEYTSYAIDNCIGIVLHLIDKQQKEIERLKEECIGDTKFDKLLFSIRMLHFHNYVNDKQFAEMIKKLSNENKGE